MPDPQPSAAAKRLAKVMLYTGLPICDETGMVDDEQAEIDIALAFDDAGVGLAVEHLSALARLAYAEGEPDSNVWVRKTRLALAALTGNDDAK